MMYYTIRYVAIMTDFSFVFLGQFEVHLQRVFPRRITYDGTSMLKTVRKIIDNLNIKDRILGTPFEQFLTQTELNLSPVLIHTLLQCKIEENELDLD